MVSHHDSRDSGASCPGQEASHAPLLLSPEPGDRGHLRPLWPAPLCGLRPPRRHRDATIQGIAGATALVGILVAAVVISLAAPHRSAAKAILAVSYDDFILPALAAMAGAIARFFL